MFPVVDEGRLVGCISTREVKEVPREEWSQRAVGDLANRCSPENTIRPEADSLEAIATMNRTAACRLLVVDGDRLMGIISLKDMLKFLSLKIELEEST